MYGFLNVKSGVFSLVFIAVIALSFAAYAQNAKPQPPVVIEFFGSTLCGDDFPAQQIAREIIESNEDVIFVNCRMQVFNRDGKSDPLSRNFCDEQRKGYFTRILPLEVRQPQIFVNGRYEMLGKNLLSAVNMARSIDKTKAIGLQYEAGALEIDIPEIESAVSSGEITLYVYAKSRYGAFVRVNETSAVQVRDLDGPENLERPDIQASVDEEVMPVSYRPVVAMAQIGFWDGKATRFSYAVHDLLPLNQRKEAQALSYVVLLHETDAYGPILAAGELKAQDITSPADDKVVLPSSKPSL